MCPTSITSGLAKENWLTPCIADSLMTQSSRLTKPDGAATDHLESLAKFSGMAADDDVEQIGLSSDCTSHRALAHRDDGGENRP